MNTEIVQLQSDLALRLNSGAKIVPSLRPSRLLVSAEVLREAGENDHGAESLGLVQVKGRDEPIEIYRLA